MIRKLLAFVLVACMPALVYAGDATQRSSMYHRAKPHMLGTSFDLLDAVACNAAEANRTVLLWLGADWVSTKYAVHYDFVSGGPASAVTLTCTESLDGTNYGSKVVKTCAAGTCTAVARVDTFAVASADKSMVLKVESEGAWYLRCIVACTGGGANEFITVQATSTMGR